MIYLHLFIAFLQVGFFSFGGGYAALPLIQHQVIDVYRWMDMADFTDLITISGMAPGAIAINCATFVGQQVAGFPGALVCTTGCVLPSLLIVLLLSVLYIKYRNLKLMQGILTGLRPAVVSMITAAGLSILILGVFNANISEIRLSDFKPVEAGLFIACFFLARRFRLGPIPIIFGSGIAGYAVYMLTGIVR